MLVVSQELQHHSRDYRVLRESQKMALIQLITVSSTYSSVWERTVHAGHLPLAHPHAQMHSALSANTPTVLDDSLWNRRLKSIAT